MVINWCVRGLGMMAKYYTAALLAGWLYYYCVALEIENNYQHHHLTGFSRIFNHHLAAYDMVIFSRFYHCHYVFRVLAAPSWTNHFFFPAQFAWQQLQAFLPAIYYLLCYYSEKNRVW